MKKSTPIFILILLLFSLRDLAQSTQDAGEYMSVIGKMNREIARDVLEYTGAVAHGKGARKVENKRQEMFREIREAKEKVAAMPPFERDSTLRDSTLAYLNTTLIVLNEEYGKILNMEEIAEQSYDAMEAYILAQQLADDHLNKANERLTTITKAFADRHKVNIVEDEKDELNRRINITAKVNRYHRMVYLLFFKCNKQEMYMVGAITAKDIRGTEDMKNILLRHTEEGLARLDTMRAYHHDHSMIHATRQALHFYKKECLEKVPVILEFYRKEQEFNQLQQEMNSQKNSKRTKEEVDFYNKKVREFNALIKSFNNTINTVNSERHKVTGNWNRASAAFLDKHTP